MNNGVAERFWSKVKKQPNGCWEWQAAKTRLGYGRFAPEGTTVKAHRVSFELCKGPIPDGMHVMHSCDNPPCVNPEHLSLGSNQDNVNDREAKGRGVMPTR